VKYKSIIDKIEANIYTRDDLARIRKNALLKVLNGDQDAQVVVDAIDRAVPTDTRIIFMGFCLGGDVGDRLDNEWKERRVCTFHHHASKHQAERFNEIWVGELIVLKKRQQIGRTMRLHGHGRAIGVKYDVDGRRYLEMDWSSQSRIIEVPLMGVNATVEPKSIGAVEREMPPEFFHWLNEPSS